MSKKEAKLKGLMSIDQVVTYLEDLTTSLKEGKICVRQGEQFVTLCPDQMVDVEVKASAKKGKEKFEMELSWHREEIQTENQAMSISSEEPAQFDSLGGTEGSPPAVSGPAIELSGDQDEKDDEKDESDDEDKVDRN
jgi:amphi-Trp domain-containing protein